MHKYCFAFLPMAAALVVFSQGDLPFKPGKLSKEQVEALRPGMRLMVYRPGEAKALDVRIVRLAALFVPEGKPASVLTPAGPFSAKLVGLLKAPLRGDHVFRLEAKGEATLLINGKEILKVKDALATGETVELAKYYNQVEVIFTSPPKGDALVRVSWKGEDFAWEPLPPHMLWTPGDDMELARRERIREGRHQFGRLECAHCHALPDGLKTGDVALPELDHRAPILTGAGHRLHTDWLAQWIFDPQALRPEATMPRVLHGPEAKQQAADLAAYLATLKEGKAPVARAHDDALVEKGAAIFNTIGCMVCHRLDDPRAEDKFGRLSLHHVAAKYRPGALETFLRQPHENYTWSRMPDFRLNDAEATALAAFLRERAKGTIAASGVMGDVERGKKLYETAGCIRCHGLATPAALATPLVPAPAGDKLSHGCLAERADTRGKAPDFALNAATRQALVEFLSSGTESLGRETLAEFSLRQVGNLQCLACHRRDGHASRWQKIREDEGEIAETLPILTWAGEKLKPDWTQKLLHGEHERRARPWLKARMPAFPARADLLAAGLSHEHGMAETENEAPPHDAKLAVSGEKLLPLAGGLNCVMCHGVGDQKATAPFEAPGINLLDAAYRIRYPYYQRWMLDPPRLDPLTRMPKLAPDGKMTPLPLFGGDAYRQFGAIWHHMQTLPKR